MKEIEFRDFEEQLSDLIGGLEPGTVLTITKDGVPVAEFRATAQPVPKPRPLGLAAGTFEVTPSFFEPLPDDLSAAFNGEAP